MASIGTVPSAVAAVGTVIALAGLAAVVVRHRSASEEESRAFCREYSVSPDEKSLAAVSLALTAGKRIRPVSVIGFAVSGLLLDSVIPHNDFIAWAILGYFVGTVVAAATFRLNVESSHMVARLQARRVRDFLPRVLVLVLLGCLGIDLALVLAGSLAQGVFREDITGILASLAAGTGLVLVALPLATHYILAQSHRVAAEELLTVSDAVRVDGIDRLSGSAVIAVGVFTFNALTLAALATPHRWLSHVLWGGILILLIGFFLAGVIGIKRQRARMRRRPQRAALGHRT